MSMEELKIRGELEMDVERDLEQEIKDGIYHLALKLHRLYQHQIFKKDNNNEIQENPRKKLLSEVNINIKMEGETTIQIKEIKKEARAPGTTSTTTTTNSARNVRGKFDWATTLRSGSSPLVKNNKSIDRDSRKGKKVDFKGMKSGVLELGWKY